MAAFRLALEQGADGVELDVRLTGTGDLIVCHDTTLERLAGGARVRIASTGLWALRQYDLGGGERVPLLADVLALMRWHFVNVEVKSDDVDVVPLVRAVIATLAWFRWRGPAVIVSSFEPRILTELRAHAPWLRRGLLLPVETMELADVTARARGVAPHAIHPHHSVCTPERVRTWRAQGLDVNTWTVDRDEDVRRVAIAGVTTIISNLPADAIAAMSG